MTVLALLFLRGLIAANLFVRAHTLLTQVTNMGGEYQLANHNLLNLQLNGLPNWDDL